MYWCNLASLVLFPGYPAVIQAVIGSGAAWGEENVKGDGEEKSAAIMCRFY